MLKRFSEWLGLKEKLHERHQTPPLVSEREIWWASVGENVGSEINGKSALFSRPVIIYKKLSHGFYFVIPTTSSYYADGRKSRATARSRGSNVAGLQGGRRCFKMALILGGMLLLAAPAQAQVNSADLKWGPAPPVLPAGAQMAVLSGDPGKAGTFVIRLKMPRRATKSPRTTTRRTST